MKFFVGAFLALLLSTSFAAEIRVKKMTRDRELERSYILKTNLAENVVLDCQSFIQGLRIGEFEEATTFMLDQEDCDSLQDRVRGSLRKFQNHCIDVEDEIRSDYSCL